MGRAEDRKKRKYINKKLTPEQFAHLESNVNKEYIDSEVKTQIAYFKKLFSECLIEAFQKNGINLTKANMIIDDVGVIMERKVSEKRGSIKERVSN